MKSKSSALTFDYKYFISNNFRNLKMKSTLTTILAIITIVGNAQTIIILGKNSFQKKWIKNETYQMIWYSVRDTAKFEIGKVSTQIESDRKIISIPLKNYIDCLWKLNKCAS